MFSLEVEADSDAKDLLIAELWEQGSTGIVEEDGLLRAFFDDAADATALQRRFGGRIVQHAPRDWVAFSQANWEPLAVGSRFYLVPQWRDDPAPPGRLRIAINPGLACGSGFHEATQLCLEALEQYQLPHMTVLDVGTGSGILSIASAMLGARRVIACDVDPAAVEIAGRAGAAVFTGSASAVRSGSCDLIVANISARASIELAPEFVRCLAPGGRLIASGFEAREALAVESAYVAVERTLTKGEWCALIVTRTPTPPVQSGSTPA